MNWIRVPSLHPRYQASTVLRTHPPSTRASDIPRGLAVELTASPVAHPNRLPLLRFESCPRVLSPLPRWDRRSRFALSIGGGGLPRYYGGSAPTTTFRGLLSVHSRYGPRGLLTPYGAFSWSTSAHLSPPEPPQVLPAGARSPAGDSTRVFETPWQGIHNNWCEQAIRPTVLGRKNYLFLGSLEGGGRRAKVFYTLLQSAKRIGLEPFEYFRDVLERLPTHSQSRIDELTPRGWAEARQQSENASDSTAL
jgi:hypothetical protein